MSSADLFVKIYGQLMLDSSLWLESPEVLKLFLFMLMGADDQGVTHVASVKVLASRCNMSLEQTTAALAVLEAPDPESRTKDHEGRRVIRQGSTWFVVNARKYREHRTRKQEADRERIAEVRAATRLVAPVATDLDLDPDLKKRNAGEAEQPYENTMQKLRNAFTKRIVDSTGMPPGWTPSNMRALLTIAAAIDEKTETEREVVLTIKRLLDGFWADSFAASEGYPIGLLASKIQKYFAPPKLSPAAGSDRPELATLKAEEATLKQQLSRAQSPAGFSLPEQHRIEREIARNARKQAELMPKSAWGGR